ncbi:elongation factor P [Acidithiobacillus ferrooxidans]|nr:elongation factor P [Acidithiobacillus ferrooxidans]
MSVGPVDFHDAADHEGANLQGLGTGIGHDYLSRDRAGQKYASRVQSTPSKGNAQKDYSMKISAFDIRPGNILEYEKGLWRVLKTDFVKPGKGGAFVQVEMKNIETGTKSNTRFRSGEAMEKAVVEPRTMQYLYADATGYVFMDNENFEQLILSEDLLEGQTGYLLPNTEIQVNLHNERPIGVELPPVVILEVREAEPSIKGQTATGSYKSAQMETGITVMVPQFVNAGEKIRVNTVDGSYIDRA